VTIDAAPIPSGATSGLVTLQARDGAPPGGQLLRIMATAETPRGRAQALEAMKIEVMAPPQLSPS